MIRRILALLALVATLFLLQAAPVLAADDQVVVDDSLHQVQVLSLLIGVVLPILVGLVTKQVTAERTKAILLALLSAVSGLATEAFNAGGFGGDFDWMAALLTTIVTFVIAVATHYGFWKPTGVAARAQAAVVK